MALDYLPSPGWAVIYGETPSATRWSELGDNDDALATGAGIDDLAILNRHLATTAVTGSKIVNYRTRRQNNGTNADETTALIQTGWNAAVPGVASGSTINVTFPTAFTTVPIVLPVYGGDQVSGAQTLGLGTNAVKDEAVVKAFDVTTTGCKFRTVSRDASNYAAGNIYYIHWIAIGS